MSKSFMLKPNLVYEANSNSREGFPRCIQVVEFVTIQFKYYDNYLIDTKLVHISGSYKTFFRHKRGHF